MSESAEISWSRTEPVSFGAQSVPDASHRILGVGVPVTGVMGTARPGVGDAVRILGGPGALGNDAEAALLEVPTVASAS